jgi:hypothetical protein
MPTGVEVFIEDGFAEITVPDRKKRAEVLNAILEHTPVALVEKDTRKGKYVIYRIPVGNAEEAGLVDGAVEGVVPLKADTGMAQDLVDADPRVSGRGGQHGEFRTITPSVVEHGYQAMPTASGHGVQDGDLNFVEPQDANGIIRQPLRPGKPVDSAPDRPAGATLSASELQKRVRAHTINPVDYAPTHVPLDQRVPSAQGTIAATVNRAPLDPSEPASGIGIGPNAGRVEPSEGDAPETPLSPSVSNVDHLETPDGDWANIEDAPAEDPDDLDASDAPRILVPDENDEPTMDWVIADMRKYAEDHGIDLEGATKKADILAKITA